MFEQNTLEKLFGGIIPGGHSIFLFNATTQSWDVPLASHPVIPLTAYFVYSNEPVQIIVTDAQEQTPPDTVLKQTWNQIGYTGTTPVTAGSYLSPIEDSWTFLIAYDADEQRYEDTIIKKGTGPYSDSRLMYPGKGYWLYSEEEIEFSPSFPDIP